MNIAFVIFAFVVGVTVSAMTAYIIFVNYKDNQKPNKDESVGQIIINWSDPDKEYFECQLYSQEFFKEVHQKETVTFDVVIR